MMDETPIKRIDIAEFRRLGYLQEANRLFFHPHGLALEVVVADDGTESLGGIWDSRDDAEGVFYSDEVLAGEEAVQRARNCHDQRVLHAPARFELFGGPGDVQPIDGWY